MIELLGFAGSALIVVSLTMKSIVRLRLVGVVGAFVFIAYGASLQAWPVVATNCVTFGIHVFHLRRIAAERVRNPETRGNDDEQQLPYSSGATDVSRSPGTGDPAQALAAPVV